MAEAIVIKIGLDAGDISQATGKIRSGIKSALDAATPDAKELGRKIGSALSDGIAEGLKKARKLLIEIQNTSGVNTTIEQDFQKHQQKLQQIAASSAARLQAINAQSAARQQQLDQQRVIFATKLAAQENAIRERGAQQQAAIAAKAAAQESAIRAKAAAQAERDARKLAETQERLARRAAPPDSAIAFFKRYSSTIREAGESIQQAGYGLLGLTAGILNVGKSAVSSAVNIDRQVNVLKALTGSAQAAEERFASLVKLSSQTPGLTTSLAATLDAQLRVANVGAGTIDKLLPAIGRLNAVSPLGDPQKFAQNLTQLITQGFERADLKELIGQSPLAGEIIKSIFKVDSATNGKAIKESAQKLGITTTDAFFAAFAEAAQNNPKLANITESLGTQFEKLRDRVLVALRPLGLAIINALKPLVDAVVPIIEKLSAAFSALPQRSQQVIIVFAALAAAVGPLVIALGGLIQTFGALGNLVTVAGGLAGGGGVAAIGATLSALLPVIAAIAAGVAALGVAWATNFGGIRELTADVIKEAIGLFSELRAFWAEIAPDLLKILQPVLDGIKAGFAFLSDVIGAEWRAIWDVVKTIVREALDFIKPLISGTLAFLAGDFEKWKTESAKFVRELWDFVLTITAQGIAALADFIQKGFASLFSTTKIAESLGKALGFNIVDGIKTGFIAAFPGTFGVISGLVGKVRSFLGNKAAARAGVSGSGLDGEEITAAQLAQNQAFLLTKPTIPSKSRLDGGSGSGLSTEESLLKRLTKQAQEADLAIKQLQDTGSKEFALRIKIEDKQAFKSELEEIIKLRRELGLPLTSPLPKDEAEAKRTIENLKAAVQNLKDFKELGEKTKDLDPLATFRAIQIKNLAEQTKKFNELQTELVQKSDGVKQATEEEALAKKLLTDQYIGLTQAQKDILLQQAREIDQADALKKATDERRKDLARDFRSAERVLRSKELEIQNAINAGVITEAQGRTAVLAIQRQSAQEQIAILQNQAALEVDSEKLAELKERIEALKGLGAELTPLQGFFKGFKSEAETLAESFERIGKSFKDSVLGVVDNGIDKLTSKLGFFKSLVGDILKSLTRVLLGGLLNGRGGAAGGSGGGGIGGFLGNLLSGGGNGGGLGSLFTGGFAGGGGGAAILGGGGGAASILGGRLPSSATGLLPALASGSSAIGQATKSISGILDLAKSGGLGDAVSIPRSLSIGNTVGIFNNGNPGGIGAFTQDTLTGGSRIGAGGLLSNLFSGIGFGKTKGSGGALAGALPLLGLSLGSSVGTDRLTSIIGGVGGLALGVGLTAAPSLFAAGGALANPAIAALFSNPITAIAGGAALLGAFLLGRARQRKRDEKTSGDALQDAVDKIKDLRKQVESNQTVLTVADARRQFDAEILQPFVAQISQLKSKSVRESRLKNQTVDLRNLFEKEVIPAVQAQKTRQGISDKLIPEFAFGGIVPGRPTPGIDSVLARLSPGEMVLTTSHQAALQGIAGRNVFQAIGVPDAGQTMGDGSQAFARGGIFSAGFSRVADTPPVINMTVQLVVSGDDATDILNAAASTDNGQQILINAQRAGRRNRL